MSARPSDRSSDKAVQHDRVAAQPQLAHALRRRVTHLQDQAIGRQLERPASSRNEGETGNRRGPVAHQVLQAQVRERVHDLGGRGRLLAERKLVGEDLELAVVDRLARDEQVGHIPVIAGARLNLSVDATWKMRSWRAAAARGSSSGASAVAAREARRVPRRGLLGPARARLRRPGGARCYVLGLAPAAHGGNRTGRVFTGDRSGDWLFAALHRAGFANQPDVRRRATTACGSTARTSPPRCAARRRPTSRARRARQLPALRRRASSSCSTDVRGGRLPRRLRLGRRLRAARRSAAVPQPRFGHGAEHALDGGPTLLGCYHPSQQNTFTGMLTEEMTDAVMQRARRLAGS